MVVDACLARIDNHKTTFRIGSKSIWVKSYTFVENWRCLGRNISAQQHAQL
jgi:hypothetical protein